MPRSRIAAAALAGILSTGAVGTVHRALSAADAQEDEQPEGEQPEGEQPEELPTHIWIWTLSPIPDEYKKNACFMEALRLAEAIAKSKKGQAAFQKVNKPNTAFGEAEVKKRGVHPEIELRERLGSRAAVAEYTGDNGNTPGGRFSAEDRIYFAKPALDRMLKQCEGAKRRDIVIYLAATLLHETAHWKDDLFKHAGTDAHKPLDGPYDTPGEEGEDLVRELFGGILEVEEDGTLEKDDKAATDEAKANWSDPAWWSS